MAEQHQWITEDQVSVMWQMPRKALAIYRPVGDCVRKTRFGFEWRADAVADTAALLKVAQTPPQKKPAPEDDAETVTVIRPTASRSTVLCRRANGQEIYVRTCNSTLFCPVGLNGLPMTFKARPAKVGPAWQIVGREPIRRGQFI